MTGAAAGEVRSLAFDPRVLRKSSTPDHDEIGSRSDQILDKRVVHHTEDRSFFVDQTEGDGTERKTMHEIRGPICDLWVHVLDREHIRTDRIHAKRRLVRQFRACSRGIRLLPDAIMTGINRVGPS